MSVLLTLIMLPFYVCAQQIGRAAGDGQSQIRGAEGEAQGQQGTGVWLCVVVLLLLVVGK